MVSTTWSRPVPAINTIFKAVNQLVELDPKDIADVMPGQFLRKEQRAFLGRVLGFHQKHDTRPPGLLRVDAIDRQPEWSASFYNLSEVRMSYWTYRAADSSGRIIVGETVNFYEPSETTTLTRTNHRAHGSRRETMRPIPPIGRIQLPRLQVIHEQLQTSINDLQIEQQATADATHPNLQFVRGDQA